MTRAEIEQIAREAAAQYGLPADVFLRLIQQESGFDPSAVSPKGAIGPAQLMPDTAAELGVDPRNVRENIFGGAKYLSQQLSRFGEMPLALAAYNAGPTRVARLGRIPNIPETQNYVKSILGSTDGQPLSAMRNDAMVGNMQTPPIFPPQQPQRQGLQGLLQRFMQPSETTGLTGPENFAAALDALILPQARMGEQIRARGAQRLQTQSRNKTIETLKQRATKGDEIARMVLQGLESGAYDAKTAMSLYMGKMLEKPSTEETFTTATGEQLNERFGTKLDPTKMYNISSTGKITQVGGAGVSIAGPEKEYEKKMGGYYAQKNIDLTNDATNAQSMLQTIDIQESLLNDPSFRSGSGQQLFDAASGFLSRFGIGEADLASNTAFQAFANKSVLDMLGGSLGTGVSNADVSFIRGTVATLDNTGESIAKLLMLQRKVAERKLKVAELARQWKVDNDTNFLDDRWDTYIANWNTENPIFPDADDYL